MTTTEDPDTTPHSESSHSDSADTTGVSGDTTGVVVGCGDGVLDTMTEECDFGTGNADDAACTSDCKMARCGDKLVQKGVEKCDDGFNDSAYGVCATDCTALAPFCGDGQVQDAYESCDEADTKNGCIASTCKWAKSCKEIREGLPDDPEVTDGVYTIKPLDAKIKVLCDMDQLMAGAWDQVEGILTANQQLREAQLGCAVATRLLERDILTLDPETAVQITAPILGRVMASPRTILATLRQTAVPRGALDSQFRRVTRPLGHLGRRLSRVAAGPDALVCLACRPGACLRD